MSSVVPLDDYALVNAPDDQAGAEAGESPYVLIQPLTAADVQRCVMEQRQRHQSHPTAEETA